MSSARAGAIVHCAPPPPLPLCRWASCAPALQSCKPRWARRRPGAARWSRRWRRRWPRRLPSAHSWRRRALKRRPLPWSARWRSCRLRNGRRRSHSCRLVHCTCRGEEGGGAPVCHNLRVPTPNTTAGASGGAVGAGGRSSSRARHTAASICTRCGRRGSIACDAWLAGDAGRRVSADARRSQQQAACGAGGCAGPHGRRSHRSICHVRHGRGEQRAQTFSHPRPLPGPRRHRSFAGRPRLHRCRRSWERRRRKRAHRPTRSPACERSCR